MTFRPNPESTYIDLSNPAARQVWDQALMRDTRNIGELLNPKLGIVGKTSAFGIQEKDDLSKAAGGTITLTMIFHLRGRGRGPGEKLKDHLEGQQTATFKLYIEKLRHGVSVTDEMTDQLVPWSAISEANDQLAPWFDRRYNVVMTAHACGLTGITDDVYRGNNVIRAIHPDHIYRPNGRAAAEDLTSADKLTNTVIQQMALRIKLTLHTIRQLSFGGMKTFLWFVSPQQVAQLYEDDSTFFAAMVAALKGGMIKDNPLFSGRAIGKWGPFTFIEHPILPPAVHTDGTLIPNTTRSFILGAQGLMIAWGRGRRPKGYSMASRYQTMADGEDWDDEQQVGAKTIYGCARPGFIDPRELDLPGVSERELGIFVVETFADCGDSGLFDSAYQDWTEAGLDLNPTFPTAS